jgi:SEC-C motif-containing protein
MRGGFMEQCFCGGTKDYKQCCAPFHEGSAWPETAEQCMRSRYSAFAAHEIDFILASHHPDTRSQVNPEEVAAWSHGSEWHGLTILGTEKGQEADEEGHVEFAALYQVDAKVHRHHERASFRRHEGKWMFFDSQILHDTVRRDGPKVGRNDPCSCGSGKKYKKCCLVA